jgi:hypothetical protein
MKQFLFFAFICFSFFSLQAQPSVSEENVQIEEETKGEIIFIRDTGYNGSAIACRTFIDENLTSKINNRRFTKHLIEAGEYDMSAQFYGKKRRKKARISKINVEAGKTHYVLLVYRVRFWNTRLDLVEITETSAQPWLEEMKEDKNY